MRSLFEVDLNLSKDYKTWIEHTVEIVCVLFLVHLFTALNTGRWRKFMNQEFIDMILFVILSLTIYWLILKKVIHFVYDDDELVLALEDYGESFI